MYKKRERERERERERDRHIPLSARPPTAASE